MRWEIWENRLVNYFCLSTHFEWRVLVLNVLRIIICLVVSYVKRLQDPSPQHLEETLIIINQKRAKGVKEEWERNHENLFEMCRELV